jgi:long-subunit acyl-CoA synthetase (AMP-forming)
MQGLVTATMKLNRKVIRETYKEQIEETLKKI